MKTRRISVLLVLTIPLLSACVPVKESHLYQRWEHQAYSVYKQPLARKASLINSIPDSNQQMVYLPEYGVVSQPNIKIPTMNQREKQYIANFYGL